MKKASGISWSTIEKAALIYLGLPVFIFLLWWFKTPWNFLFAGLAGWGLWGAMKRGCRTRPGSEGGSAPENNSPLLEGGAGGGCGSLSSDAPPSGLSRAADAAEGEFHYSWREVVAIIFGCALVAFVMGVGGWMPQSADYEQANEFFRGLTPSHWPWECRFLDGKSFSVVYYFGYHLIPAIFGALGGQSAVDISSFALATLGLSLGAVGLGKYFRLPAWTLFLLFGFAGLSWVGDLFWGRSGDEKMFFIWWAHPWRNIPISETLFFAAHHFITPLILTPLVLRAADEGRVGKALLWVALGLFWSPLTAIGAGMVGGLYVVWGLSTRFPGMNSWANPDKSGRSASLREVPMGLSRTAGAVKKEVVRQMISIALITLGIVFPIWVFYSTRLYPDKLIFLGGDVFSLGWKYPCFALLEFGVWFALIRGGLWREGRTWALLFLFLAASFFTMGQSLDLFYRLDQAWQLVLFALVMRSLLDKPGLLRITLFTLVYLLGAVAPGCCFYQKFSGERVPLTRECRYDPEDYLSSCSRISLQFWGDPGKNALSRALLRRASVFLEIPKRSGDSQISVFVSERVSMIVSSGKRVDKNIGLFPWVGVVPWQAWEFPMMAHVVLGNRGEEVPMRLSFRMDNMTSKEIPIEITRYWIAEGRPVRPLYSAVEVLEYKRRHPFEKVPPDSENEKVREKMDFILPVRGKDVTLEMKLPKGVSKLDISGRGDMVIQGGEVLPQFRISRLKWQVEGQGEPSSNAHH